MFCSIFLSQLLGDADKKEKIYGLQQEIVFPTSQGHSSVQKESSLFLYIGEDRQRIRK